MLRAVTTRQEHRELRADFDQPVREAARVGDGFESLEAARDRWRPAGGPHLVAPVRAGTRLEQVERPTDPGREELAASAATREAWLPERRMSCTRPGCCRIPPLGWRHEPPPRPAATVTRRGPGTIA